MIQNAMLASSYLFLDNAGWIDSFTTQYFHHFFWILNNERGSLEIRSQTGHANTVKFTKSPRQFGPCLIDVCFVHGRCLTIRLNHGSNQWQGWNFDELKVVVWQVLLDRRSRGLPRTSSCPWMIWLLWAFGSVKTIRNGAGALPCLILRR